MTDELDILEQEVLDELENPYRPYQVIFPYEVRLTIPSYGRFWVMADQAAAL